MIILVKYCRHSFSFDNNKNNSIAHQSPTSKETMKYIRNGKKREKYVHYCFSSLPHCTNRGREGAVVVLFLG